MDLHDATETLRARSVERRKRDSRFVAREKLLARFAERQKRRTISLCLDERREQAKEELKLEDLQKVEVDGDGSSEEKPKETPASDLVMEEGLQVLSDWIGLQAQSAATRKN